MAKMSTWIRSFITMAAIILLAIPASVSALDAENVQARIEGNRVSVTYDIPGDQAVDVEVGFSDENGPLKHSAVALSGDVGKGVAPGKGKRIIWDFLKDYTHGLMSRDLAATVTITGDAISGANGAEKGGTMPKVRIETSMGIIVAELDQEKAPISVENFLGYVRDGYFDGTIFHRVIDGFMIQGGGFAPDMGPKKSGKAPVKNEAANGLENDRGTLAMARTSVVDSATSQFFINLVDNDFLNHRDTTAAGFGYAVFGRVVEGMDVVDAIGKAETGRHGMFQDVPKEAIVMEKVTVIE